MRISFGLSLLFMGIIHYKTFPDFTSYVSTGLGPLTGLGTLWSYALPALMIVGGILFTVGLMPSVAAWTAGLALASIPAGMMLKSVLSATPVDAMMAAAVNAFVWLLVYYFALRSLSCCGSDACGTGAACDCGSKACPVCGPVMKPPAPAPVKAAVPVKPATPVVKKAPAKKKGETQKL